MSKERQEIARNLEARGKLSEHSRLKREGNQVSQLMLKLMSNVEVDKLKLYNDEVDK